MGSQIFVPALEKETFTTKDYIITSLLKHGSMNLTKLYNTLKKEFGYSVTYQAVRKANLILLNSGVLIDIDSHSYAINEDWIKQLESFCHNYRYNFNQFNAHRVLSDLSTGSKIVVLEFKTLCERRDFIDEFENLILPQLKCKEVAIRVPQTYRGFNPEKAKERMNSYLKYGAKMFAVYRFENKLNRLAAKLYTQYGAKIKCGVECDNDNWFIVYDDIVIQTIPSQEFKELETKFGGLKSVEEKAYDFLENFFHHKSNLKVILQKNKIFAELVKKEIIACFK